MLQDAFPPTPRSYKAGRSPDGHRIGESEKLDVRHFELTCPWESATNDMQECVTLLDYMDSYDISFAKPSERLLFLRMLQLAVELLETAQPEHLCDAGIDLARICCKSYAAYRPKGTRIQPSPVQDRAAIAHGIDPSAFFGSQWQAMFSEIGSRQSSWTTLPQ